VKGLCGREASLLTSILFLLCFKRKTAHAATEHPQSQIVTVIVQSSASYLNNKKQPAKSAGLNISLRFDNFLKVVKSIRGYAKIFFRLATASSGNISLS
jgi:hypothetical protein